MSDSWIYQALLENQILPTVSQGNSKKHLIITFHNTEYYPNHSHFTMFFMLPFKEYFVILYIIEWPIFHENIYTYRFLPTVQLMLLSSQLYLLVEDFLLKVPWKITTVMIGGLTRSWGISTG